MIEKIERLDKCLKLRELNLSYNLLTKIEGLENLMYLQVLNLTGNKIQHIPVWLAKRLRALRTLHLGKNNLQSVSLLCLLSSQDKVNIAFLIIGMHISEQCYLYRNSHLYYCIVIHEYWITYLSITYNDTLYGIIINIYG